MAVLTITAPPSSTYTRNQKVARVKALRAKNSRSAAETKELVDNLIAMLPPDIAALVTST